jgi:lipid-A-disaccharide synthase
MPFEDVDRLRLDSPPAVDAELLLVAGEASGDLHGARMLSELQGLAPGIRTFGLGGQELRSAGMEPVADSSEISVVGISEALRVVPRARQIFARLLAEVERRRARAAVLIDFPDFNLRLARALKQRGVRVLYYISPQVWAWRRGRVHTIARLVDRMLVVFPFEVDFYRRYGVRVTHVGHPLVDEIPICRQAWDAAEDPPEVLQIALLPGSRASELESNLPAMLAGAELLSAIRPCRFLLIKAPTVSTEKLRDGLEARSLDLEIVAEDRFEAVASSHLAICASGTATLEVGLLGTPMVVVYRVRPWTYLLGRLLVRLPHIALVNLVLEERVVPELLQAAASPGRIAAEASEILRDRDRIQRMRSSLGRLRERLGEAGASRRAAREILGELQRLEPESEVGRPS